MSKKQHAWGDVMEGNLETIKYKAGMWKRRAWRMGDPPMDLGEIPRTYALKVLFGIQPCTDLQLWEALKVFPDCPFGSFDHLKHVLRMAKEMDWVYTEKNLANDELHFHIKRHRQDVVHEMILESRAQEDVAERQAREAREKEAATRREEKNAARDQRIQQLQQQLVANVARLIEHDRALVKDMPWVVSSDGAIDFMWHRREAADATESS